MGQEKISDLHQIMGAVNRLVCTLLPVDENGHTNMTSEIMEMVGTIQDYICDALGSERVLYSPDDCLVQEMRYRMASSMTNLMAKDPDWWDEACLIRDMLWEAGIYPPPPGGGNSAGLV